jgi:hypothetical protein
MVPREPAQRYGLYALNWIASVNDVETPTIDAFIEATRGLPDGSFVRLKLIGLTGRPKVLTLKLDRNYWPTWELRRRDDGSGEWERVDVRRLTTRCVRLLLILLVIRHTVV